MYCSFSSSQAKIKQDGVYLFTIVQSVSNVLYGRNELRFTGSFLSESMFYITVELVTVKVATHMAVYYVFKDLAAY